MLRIFKDLNKVDIEDTEELNLNDLEPVEVSGYRNEPFSEAEVRKAAKSLKSGNSCGDDHGVFTNTFKRALMFGCRYMSQGTVLLRNIYDVQQHTIATSCNDFPAYTSGLYAK